VITVTFASHQVGSFDILKALDVLMISGDNIYLKIMWRMTDSTRICLYIIVMKVACPCKMICSVLSQKVLLFRVVTYA
jgi:hypothetical protein